MTKFEQTGINFQYSSGTKDDAIRNFRRSCECCCTRGLHIECDNCAIAAVHSLVIAAFDSKKN